MELNNIFLTILGQLPGFIAGIISALIIAMATGFIKEFFDERTRKKKHRLEVARQIIKICNEAETNFYGQPPRDIEHINSVTIDTLGIDKKVGTQMKEFIDMWIGVNSFIKEHPPNTVPNVEKRDRIVKEITIRKEILVDWANKIRIGK